MRCADVSSPVPWGSVLQEHIHILEIFKLIANVLKHLNIFVADLYAFPGCQEHKLHLEFMFLRVESETATLLLTLSS